MAEDLPRIIVFDLDGTLWEPEMYQLDGGAPFKADRHNPNIVRDRSGTEVELIGESRAVIQEVLTDPKWRDTYLAISSTCDMPHWARALMNIFSFTNAEGKTVTMHQVFGELQEIYYAAKSKHHRTLLKKVHALDNEVNDYADMLFFDNQMNNISNVSALGVPCCYCPNGMTPGTFQRGLKIWRENRKSSL